MKPRRNQTLPTELIRFTREGFEKLQQELKNLQAQRPTVVEDLKKARELGDLKENGYYKASRQKLSFIDGQIRKITYQLKYAQIVANKHADHVQIGSVVTISDGQKQITYQIVGDLEANPSEGKISLLSPLGKALYNKKQNDEVTLHLPERTKIFKLIKLS